jgi:hypothetical protein
LGYPFIVFQPHDLVQTNKNGIILDTGLLKSTGVHGLSHLIDTFLSTRKVSALSEIMGIDPKSIYIFDEK